MKCVVELVRAVLDEAQLVSNRYLPPSVGLTLEPAKHMTASHTRSDGTQTVLSPASFWSLYQEELRDKATRDAYRENPTWTPVALAAAQEVCRRFGVTPQPEYFRLDVAGWQPHPGGEKHRWDLRVAFEHENYEWRDELCKLTHIVADLRVLIGYHKHTSRGPTPREELQEAVDRLEGRMTRVPHSEWLFTLGPRNAGLQHPFEAFFLNSDGVVTPVDEDAPLWPKDFPEA